MTELLFNMQIYYKKHSNVYKEKPGTTVMSMSRFTIDPSNSFPRAGLPQLGERFVTEQVTIDIFPETAFKAQFFTTKDLILISMGGSVEVLLPGLQNRSFCASLQPGRFHFIPRGIMATIESKETGVDLIGFSLSERFRQQAQIALSTHFEPRYLFNVNTSKVGVLGEWTRQFYRESKRGGELIANALTTLLTALVAEAFREPKNYATSAPRPKTSDKSIERSLDFIERNLHKNIHLKDIAAAACQSLFHYSRTFTAEMGTSPKAYLNERRIERAKLMLVNEPDTPIAQIASACGFNSQSHLSTVFKKTTGRTPNQFRKESFVDAND